MNAILTSLDQIIENNPCSFAGVVTLRSFMQLTWTISLESVKEGQKLLVAIRVWWWRKKSIMTSAKKRQQT
jgi:hypothetical protein